jgi:hypothetical protein
MTKEEKAAADKAAKRAFFALYIDQVVWRSDGIPHRHPKVLSTYEITNIQHFDYLELTDLRNITDEHAEVIATRYFPVHEKSKFYDYIREEWIQKNIGSLDGFTIDFLRRHGYAVPFRSDSVEDLVRMGWAKIKEQ